MDLKQIVSSHSLAYRGYVLDTQMQPASDKVIAMMVGFEPNDCAKYLEVLEEIGLIKKVPLPDWAQREKELLDSEEKVGSGWVQGGTQHPPALNKTKLKKSKQTANGNGKAKEKKKSASAAPLPKTEKNIQPQKKAKPKNNQQDKLKAESKQNNAKQANRQSTGKDAATAGLNASSPTSAPPIADKPTDSDAGRQQTQHSNVQKLPAPAANVIDFEQTARLLDPAAKEFAAQIYARLSLPWPADSSEGYRELANFQQAWINAQRAGIGVAGLATLWESAMHHADAVAAKRRRKPGTIPKPARLWRYLFNKSLIKAISGVRSCKQAS